MNDAPESRGLPAGLRRAYLLALAPAAFLAPIPLDFTRGASLKAIAVYEIALAFLWTRARAGRPVRLSNTMLNVVGPWVLGLVHHDHRCPACFDLTAAAGHFVARHHRLVGRREHVTA